MSRELLVFRHGKSDWGGDTTSDFDRPLATRGKKAVKRMGRWLLEHERIPEQILSSPALRARQTSERLCRHMEIPDSTISWREEVYLAGVTTLLEVLSGSDPACRRLMIVGHNPGFESLVDYLSGEPALSAARGPAFPTAALASLAMPGDWRRLEPGCAQLLALIRPRELDT